MRRYLPILRDIMRNNQDPHLFKFITLTWGPVAVPASADIRVLDRAAALLHRFFAGGMAAMEYSERLHLHTHALVVGPYLRKVELSEAWKKVTGRYIVDIDDVERDRVERALRYILKYVAKPLPFSDVETMARFVGAHYHRRKIRTFGILWGYWSRVAMRAPPAETPSDLVYEGTILPLPLQDDLSRLYLRAGLLPPRSLLPSRFAT